MTWGNFKPFKNSFADSRCFFFSAMVQRYSGQALQLLQQVFGLRCQCGAQLWLLTMPMQSMLLCQCCLLLTLLKVDGLLSTFMRARFDPTTSNTRSWPIIHHFKIRKGTDFRCSVCICELYVDCFDRGLNCPPRVSMKSFTGGAAEVLLQCCTKCHDNPKKFESNCTT